ncbi:MAG TPA: hypothetical protein VHW65_02385 [Gemmatimonadales bacterium]|jgi:hypothetical protein|nr:hypothetical protein [Gemmatimonadales bacterium]
MRRVQLTLVSISLGAAALGCSAILPSNSRTLSGSWGGTNISAVATSKRLVVTLTCEVETFTGPINVAADGGFASSGTVEYGLNSRPTSISGRLVGDYALVIGADTLLAGRPLLATTGEGICAD